MNLCRAKINRREVVGWYVHLKNNTHAIILDEESVSLIREAIVVRVSQIDDPATAAFDTGRTDKNGDRIFGSKGEFQGGDRVRVVVMADVAVAWDTDKACWGFAKDNDDDVEMETSLGSWSSDELEIIKEAE